MPLDAEFRMLPPSAYSLLPPVAPAGAASTANNNSNANNNTNNFQAAPYMPYPHMPFWTAAPLPFSPTMYPQNVLPLMARESLLAPIAPPNPPVANRNKKGGARRATKTRKAKAPTRVRGPDGTFVKVRACVGGCASVYCVAMCGCACGC